MTKEQQRLHQKIAEELLERYGHMISSRDLPKVLGFSNGVALRQAVSRGHVSIRLFQIPHRRGKFAYSEDVAKWLAKQIKPPKESPITEN